LLFIVRGLSADENPARLRVDQADADDGRARGRTQRIPESPFLNLEVPVRGWIMG
jgi:hypothetical protein